MRAATVEELLADSESLAGGLEHAGWRRGISGGTWVCAADPAWTVQSSVHPPSLSVFARGEDVVVAEAAGRIAEHLSAPEGHGLVPGQPDPDWRSWSAPAVAVTLYIFPTRTVGHPPHLIEMPGSLQLALERSDAPNEGLSSDPARARKVAREGSAMQRWYLAGEEDLPEDVVQVLAQDDDPEVVAALAVGARQRQAYRDGLEAGFEDA